MKVFKLLGLCSFDGSWQYVDSVYDSRGRLEKTSLPFKGSSPTHWNSYTYDTYNRPTKLTEASGKYSTWSYSGLSVTEIRSGIETTKTTDASGALISVTDPGGTITYALRPDGQPSSITAPGGVATTFGYDEYGRQTSIADPSAGTQTFSDGFTALGVRVNTVTDANNKTVTTISDKYGRVEDIYRPEFSTNYIYDSDGRLASKTSSNGTSSVFTYDAYDRLATARENAPDGKWLKKTFGYANGNVSSVQYESQNGSIATENFVYANGHNTEIRLNGTTTIWKLTEENALGQPTKATTGSINRTYSYTAYGMPTGRTAGSLQNLTYDFDVQRGNLLSRTDNGRSKTETFGYDNLNRLTNAEGQAIGYSANGNITAMLGVGTLAYENSAKPYQVTMLTPTGTAAPIREQSVTYTSFQRPNTIS